MKSIWVLSRLERNYNRRKLKMKQGWLGLEDHVVVVTGGASGIGKHVADTLMAAGAKAVLSLIHI